MRGQGLGKKGRVKGQRQRAQRHKVVLGDRVEGLGEDFLILGSKGLGTEA